MAIRFALNDILTGEYIVGTPVWQQQCWHPGRRM